MSKFYARRTLRIFPAFWVLCAIFLVVSLVLHRRIHWPAWIACVFYVSNYYMAFHGFGSTLNHSWSLAIEEQFYLLWPAAFRRFAANSRHLERILVGVILAVWIYRAILEFRLRMDWVYIYCAFGTRADALAIGCLLAILAFNERIPHWLVENKTPAGIAAFIIVMVPFSGIGNGVEFYLFPPAFAVLILHAIVYHRSRVYHWLNWAPVRQIGMWSYSIYLYHIFSHRVVPDRLGFIKMPLEILVALGLGAGSYYLVEKPVLALRDRWFVSERS